MANHMTKRKTERQRARHYAKPSRAKRHERRWDARVEEMNADLASRTRTQVAVHMDEIDRAILSVEF